MDPGGPTDGAGPRGRGREPRGRHAGRGSGRSAGSGSREGRGRRHHDSTGPPAPGAAEATAEPPAIASRPPPAPRPRATQPAHRISPTIVGDRHHWHQEMDQLGHISPSTVISRAPTSLANTTPAKELSPLSTADLEYAASVSPMAGHSRGAYLLAAGGMSNLAITNSSRHEELPTSRATVYGLAATDAAGSLLTRRAVGGVIVGHSPDDAAQLLVEQLQRVVPGVHGHVSQTQQQNYTMTGERNPCQTVSVALVAPTASLATLTRTAATTPAAMLIGGTTDKRIGPGYPPVKISNGASAKLPDVEESSVPFSNREPKGGVCLRVVVRPLVPGDPPDIQRAMLEGAITDICLETEGQPPRTLEDINDDMHALYLSTLYALLDMRLEHARSSHKTATGEDVPLRYCYMARVYNEAVATQLRRGCIWRFGNAYGALEIAVLDAQPDGGYTSGALLTSINHGGLALLTCNGSPSTITENSLPAFFQQIQRDHQAAWAHQRTTLGDAAAEMQGEDRTAADRALKATSNLRLVHPLNVRLRGGAAATVEQLTPSHLQPSSPADALFVQTSGGTLALSQLTPTAMRDGARVWQLGRGSTLTICPADPASFARMLLMGPGAGEYVKSHWLGDMATGAEVAIGLKPAAAQAHLRLFDEASSRVEERDTDAYQDAGHSYLSQRWAPLAAAGRALELVKQPPAPPATEPLHLPRMTAEGVARYKELEPAALVDYVHASLTLCSAPRAVPAALPDGNAPPPPPRVSPVKRDRAAVRAAVALMRQQAEAAAQQAAADAAMQEAAAAAQQAAADAAAQQAAADAAAQQAAADAAAQQAAADAAAQQAAADAAVQQAAAGAAAQQAAADAAAQQAAADTPAGAAAQAAAADAAAKQAAARAAARAAQGAAERDRPDKQRMGDDPMAE